MNVKVFGGHRETSVNSIASTTANCPSFIANFTSCDAKGFVATWDVRSPKRMAHCALPFLTTLMERQKQQQASNNNNKNNQCDDETIEIQEVVNVGEHFTVAVSEEDIAMIDWRKPRVPVWTHHLASSSEKEEATSPFACCFNRRGGAGGSSNSGDIVIFHEEGQVSILDDKTGKVIRSSPKSLSDRDEMQLLCGATSLSSHFYQNNNSDGNNTTTSLQQLNRFAVVASTFGKVSLLDLESWSIIGSTALGGMKDEAKQEDDDPEKTAVEKMTNPPLLSSLSCASSPFLIGTNSRNKNDEEDTENNEVIQKSALSASTALVSRADGVVAFAHLQPNTYPAVTRLADITTTNLAHSLCSANWIRHCDSTSNSSSAIISCVGTNGLVSLWQVPAAGFSVADDDDDENDDDENEQDDDDDEAELKELNQVNLIDIKYTANEPQKLAVKNSRSGEGIEVNCSCVIRNGSSGVATGLVVGDTAGRILWIDV